METSPTVFPFFSVQLSCSAMSYALQPHDCSMPGLAVHHQLPEFTQICVHWVCDDTQPSYSVVPVSSCLQSFPASGCFQMSPFFASGGQSIRVSTSASVCPIFFPASLNLSASIIYYGLDGMFLWGSMTVQSVWYPEWGWIWWITSHIFPQVVPSAIALGGDLWCQG